MSTTKTNSTPRTWALLPGDPVDGSDRVVQLPWQGPALARAAVLRAWWPAQRAPAADDPLTVQFHRLLCRAERTCTTRPSWAARLSGAAVESAWHDLHAAEELLAAARRRAVSTPPADEKVPLHHGDRGATHQRARTFRAMILGAAVLVAGSAVALAVLGYLAPSSLPMCTATGDTCVTAGGDRRLDVTVVAVIGAAAGTLSGTVALRRLRGTTTPYRVPLALALLKVPTGALTAVLGVLLLRSGLAGTTLEPDSGAALLGGVVVLGLAQELLTRLADQQGQAVLDDVRGSSAAPPG